MISDKRYGELSDVCVYCGQPSTDWEHVIPRSFAVPTLIVRACSECNGLANSGVFDTIMHKQAAIQALLRKRYSKLVNREKWTSAELKQVSRKLRVMIEAAERESDILSRRLSWVVPTDVVDAYSDLMTRVARERLRESMRET